MYSSLLLSLGQFAIVTACLFGLVGCDRAQSVRENKRSPSAKELPQPDSSDASPQDLRDETKVSSPVVQAVQESSSSVPLAVEFSTFVPAPQPKPIPAPAPLPAYSTAPPPFVWPTSVAVSAPVPPTTTPSLFPPDVWTPGISPDLSLMPSPTPLLRPEDYSGMFWVGDGYDALSGERRSTCLDAKDAQYRSYPVNQVYDTLDFVYSHEDLAKKLNVEFNAEASGTYQNVTLSRSIKTNILRETQITAGTVVALATLRFVKDRLTVYGSVPPLNPTKREELRTDKLYFRQHCGDKFTRTIWTGTHLILVLKAEQNTLTTYTFAQIQSALKVGFNQVFGTSVETKVTSEQKQILEQFRVSSRCYAEGASAHPCGDNGLNLTGVSMTDNSVLNRIAAAKKALATDIESGKNLAALEEVYETYPVPRDEGEKAPEQVFFDYDSYLKKLKDWLRLESRVRLICNSLNRIEDACDEAAVRVAEGIEGCAQQSLWPRGQCRAPEVAEFEPILSQANAGTVRFFAKGGAQGRKIVLDFRNLLSRNSVFEPFRLYSLHTPGMHFGDELSSVLTELKNGWRLVIYEHQDGTGRQFILDPESPNYVDAARFNDKASSFRLERR